MQPTSSRATTRCASSRRRSSARSLSVTKFKDDEEALAIANDTLYGLGAGVWTRDGTRAYRFGRAIQAGRVWTNCYHLYPAHAAFGGYKQSRHRPRKPQDDAGPLPADQEHAGQLLAQSNGLLLAGEGKASASFLKKRSKKPLSVLSRIK